MKSTGYILLIVSFFVIGSCSPSGQRAMKLYEEGNRELKSGNLINSIIYYNRAIAMDSMNADFYMARGNAKLTTVDYEGATKDYTKVIELEPQNADAYLLRAMIKIYKKEFTDDAVSDLKKAIQLNPNLAKAYYNLGVIKFVQNDKEAACEYWKKAADMGFDQAKLNLKKHCLQR